jgi:hypothetical protein
LLLVSCYSVPFYGEPGGLGTYAVERQVEAIKDEHEGFVHRAVERATAAERHVPIESELVLGSASIVLAHSAGSRGVLVVGSTGHSGRLADIVGSTATAVCHHAAVPVVVVPASTSRRENSMKKIVVGIDGSEAARDALRWAYEEARLAGAELVILHCWDYPYSEVADGTEDVRRTMERDATGQLRSASAALVEQATRDGIVVTPKLVEKTAAQALVDEAGGADLVVVGSRGRGGLSSLLLGSVSRAVVQHSPCPVAVIRHAAH